MANPTPIPPINLLGKGGDNRANLTPFKPGERRVGRAKGTPNRISNIPNRLPEFMQRLFRAAESLGYLRQGLVTDKDGNPEVDANGTPTGRMDWVATGEDGFDGYLKWLGKTNSTAFVALIKSMVPHQVNVRTEKAEPEKYRTVEEVAGQHKVGLVQRCRGKTVTLLHALLSATATMALAKAVSPCLGNIR